MRKALAASAALVAVSALRRRPRCISEIASSAPSAEVDAAGAGAWGLAGGAVSVASTLGGEGSETAELASEGGRGGEKENELASERGLAPSPRGRPLRPPSCLLLRREDPPLRSADWSAPPRLPLLLPELAPLSPPPPLPPADDGSAAVAGSASWSNARAPSSTAVSKSCFLLHVLTKLRTLRRLLLLAPSDSPSDSVLTTSFRMFGSHLAATRTRSVLFSAAGALREQMASMRQSAGSLWDGGRPCVCATSPPRSSSAWPCWLSAKFAASKMEDLLDVSFCSIDAHF